MNYTFQAEIKQLMSLIVNAFYSNKDIFLRELLSNASDAIDKARFIALKENTESREHHIDIRSDDNILVIQDTGVGMTKDELIRNLGTIANSGTKKFMENTDNHNLIGQFGVGFYSAFLVADRVKVYTKHADEPQTWCWSSDSEGFTIEESSDNDLPHGTRIELTLKDPEYTQFSKLESIINTHCRYINYPIRIEKKTIEKRKKDLSEQTEQTEKTEQDQTEKPEETEEIETREWVRVNDHEPVWVRSSEDVSEEDYHAFYKTLHKDFENPLAYKTFEVEGQATFKALLYIPKRAPQEMFDVYKRQSKLNLHVKRVLVQENCDELVPDWLSFVVGIVDSEDLPLNVSRELLQKNSKLAVMRKNVVKKCVEMFSEIPEDKYTDFYKEYHQNIKLGIHQNKDNHKEKLMPLLRFLSAKQDKLISLEEYLESKPDKIYYITGASKEALMNSPFVRGTIEQEHDVLLLVDPIDEHLMQNVKDYNDVPFVNISRFDDNADSDHAVCKKMAESLGDKVEKVVLTKRLPTNVPCAVVSGKYGWTANMERLAKAQTLKAGGSNPGEDVIRKMYNKRILEVNPDHPVIQGVASKAPGKPLNDLVGLLYETALLASGFVMENPCEFTDRVFNMIALGLDPESEAAESPEVAESPEAAENNETESHAAAETNEPEAESPESENFEQVD
jgi:molecular chaperone HtpG